MTGKEQLFLDTVRDIQSKIVENNRYSITRASALLRQLLIDESPLIHQVNRRHRLKLEFETIDFTMKPPLKPLLHWQNLDASPFPRARKVRIDLDGLLRAQCLTFKEHEYSVLDILKACAHLKGGVHSGTPKTDKEEALLDLDEVFKIGPLDGSLAALRGILIVTLAGLRPLIDAIQNDKQSPAA
jgi:hypothetical protein